MGAVGFALASPPARAHEPRPVQRSHASRRRHCLVSRPAHEQELVVSRAVDVPRNPIGVHALVFAGDFSGRAGCDAAVSGAQRTGYDLLEVPLMDNANMQFDMLASMTQRAGLQVSCSLGLSDQDDISSSDADTVHRGQVRLLNAVDRAAQLGADTLTGCVYSKLGRYTQPRSQKGMENCICVLQRVAEKCRANGMRLGIEPCNRYETNVVNTVHDALELIDKVDPASKDAQSNVFVHGDIYHMRIEEMDIGAAIQQASNAGRLGYIHLGASHRGKLGTGVGAAMDLNVLFAALAAVGYSGPLVFESFSRRIVQADLSSVLCIWREMWRDSDELASGAHDLITQMWSSAVRLQHSIREVPPTMTTDAGI
ncbi:L-ribulose 3-epimerase [Porphyridium purpureum]|uniref:L-ribulose 3-epimerase n=1 Tax=Porphyridium purpureum TaxID=35688 RepID=A0A5J4Z2G6_PORPP|nr:L-ribulose 3-epimerase [Porphyridium purpureum]|eukprot:POR4175..scf208_2